MAEYSIREAQVVVDKWINSVGITYFPELTNTAILMEEVGEMARLMARMFGEQSFKRPEDEAAAGENLAEEMADVLFVLICLANQTGVDLTAAFNASMDKKTKRDKDRHQANEKLQALKAKKVADQDSESAG